MQAILYHRATPYVCLGVAGISALGAGAVAACGGSALLAITAVAVAALALVAYAVVRSKASKPLVPTDIVVHSKAGEMLSWECRIRGTPVVVEERTEKDKLYKSLDSSLINHCGGVEHQTPKSLKNMLVSTHSRESTYDASKSSQSLFLPISFNSRGSSRLTTGVHRAIEAVKLFLAEGNSADKITILFFRPVSGYTSPTPENVGLFGNLENIDKYPT